MQLARRNPDFRAHAKLTTICKLRGGIAHQNRAIELMEKAVRNGIVFRQNGVGVVASETPDMSNRGVHTVDNLGRDDRIKELLNKIY